LAAFISPVNSGEGFLYVELYSGWLCVAMKNLWFGSSMNSTTFSCSFFPEIISPFSSSVCMYCGFTSYLCLCLS